MKKLQTSVELDNRIYYIHVGSFEKEIKHDAFFTLNFFWSALQVRSPLTCGLVYLLSHKCQFCFWKHKRNPSSRLHEKSSDLGSWSQIRNTWLLIDLLPYGRTLYSILLRKFVFEMWKLGLDRKIMHMSRH